MTSGWRETLSAGTVIPASPLALTPDRKLDERRQRALWRYYEAAGAGGVAVGVHTTQFAIRDPKFGLFRPLLELAKDEFDRLDANRSQQFVRVAGVCGETRQAIFEAEAARELGFQAGLLNLSALRTASDGELIAHCRRVAEALPVFGFYLQPGIGGRELPYAFWRGFCEIEPIVAIKIAPFNRYQTIDVVRAVAEGGRQDIALYTGNDDNIVLDLLTPFRFRVDGQSVERRIVGGLLGHWAVWTKTAVMIHRQCRALATSGYTVPSDMLRLANEVTDANAAFFDAANGYGGCIPGIHEVLRRQGLLEAIVLLDPEERLGPGQAEEIDRVRAAYPDQADDGFVASHLDEWMRP